MLNTFASRLAAALILTPGITLLLVWIARFANPEEAARLGAVNFLLWAFGVAFGISAMVTLYIAYLAKTARRE